MKKNLILFFILTSLLFVTYLVKEQNLFERNSLLSKSDINEFSSFKVPKAELTLKKGTWYYLGDNLPVSRDKLDHFFKILTHIEIEDELETSEVDINKEELYRITWQKGDQTQVFKIYSFSTITGRITISYNNKYYRAILGHSTEGLYQDELSLQSRLYSELRYYLTQDHAFFKDNYFYPAPDDMITLEIRDKLKVNFKKQKTSPEVLAGLNYKNDFLFELNKLLKKIKITDFLLDSVELTQELAWITLNDTRWLTLFGQANGSKGTYLLDHRLNRKFEVDSGHLDLFFIKPEYFWSLQPLSEKELDNLNQTTLKMSQGDQGITIKIPNAENFTIKVLNDISINEKAITEFFKLLFAVDPYEQAYRVSAVKDEITQERLKVEILGHELYFWLSSGFIHLYDVGSNLVFSYVDNGSSFKSGSIKQFLLE